MSMLPTNRSYSIYFKFILIGLPFLALLAWGRLDAQTETKVIVKPVQSALDAGGSTTVDIQIEMEEGSAYGTGSYILTYDPTILTLTDFEINTDRLMGVVNVESDGPTARIRFNAVAFVGPLDQPLTGLVTLATGTFEGVTNGVTDLDLTFRPGDEPKDSTIMDLNAQVVPATIEVGESDQAYRLMLPIVANRSDLR